MRVNVRNLLPGVRAAVEDRTVAGAVDALGDRGLVREAAHFLEQAAARLGNRREVNVMFFRYDQYMRGSLRVDITERDSP